jgi:multidrug efflux system membrane fusion protein
MNIRIPNSFESVPDAVQTLPGRVRQSYRQASSRTRLILGIVGALVLVGLAYYFLSGPARPKAPPPPPVIVQRVEVMDLPVIEHTIGTVVSPATVQVTARVQGEIQRAFFTEGQEVHTGDLLFQIDPRPYKAAYDNAAATLTAAKAKADRYARLLAQKAVAPQDADDARAAYGVAVANADAARLNLGYTQIRSPIDGKTGPILIQPGNQVMASAGASGGVATAPAQQPALVVITQVRPIRISFALPQADLPRIQQRMSLPQGMPVTLTPQGTAGSKPLTAQVNFVGNQVNDQTGTIELRATFSNESGTLVPGQLVDVGVVLDTLKSVTVVPHDAINLGPNLSFVYIVKNGIAQMVPITVIHDDGTTAAIRGNVRAGDTIITDGQLRVTPGKPVSVSKPAPHSKT